MIPNPYISYQVLSMHQSIPSVLLFPEGFFVLKHYRSKNQVLRSFAEALLQYFAFGRFQRNLRKSSILDFSFFNSDFE